MNYHNKIMNLRCVGWNDLYKEGHRDARHAAAELALDADATIDELLEVLEEMCDGFDSVSYTAWTPSMHKAVDVIKKTRNAT